MLQAFNPFADPNEAAVIEHAVLVERLCDHMTDDGCLRLLDISNLPLNVRQTIAFRMGLEYWSEAETGKERLV